MGLDNKSNEIFIKKILRKLYYKRAKIIFSEIKGYIKSGERVLDIGAGDCLIAKMIREQIKTDVTAMDVVDYNLTDLQLIVYDGKKLPFSNCEFDEVILSVVLHHCANPMIVLDEAIRVSKKKIIIIESVFFSSFSKYWSYFFDWYWNRLLHKVPCPFNHKTSEEWKRIFLEKGLKICDSQYLGIDIWYIPELHHLYYLEK